MSRVVEQAREYLAHNAAESGGDALIADLCAEVENYKRIAEIDRARCDQAMQSLDRVIRQLSFVSSCFGPPDIKGPDGNFYTLKDEAKLAAFEAVRNHLHRQT